MQALDRVRDLLDRHDDLYTNHKSLIDADAAFHVIELLSDESDAVAVRAALVIARITEHSVPAKARLTSSPLIGIETNISKVMLNPVQDNFINAGAVPKLIPWLISPMHQKSDAASEALANISSYNLDGKIACLAAIVEALGSGQFQYLPALDGVIDGMELSTSSEALELVKKALDPVVQALKLSGQQESQWALAVLGTICEKAPELASSDVQVSAEVPLVVTTCLLKGNLQVQDMAARALWYLTAGSDVTWGPEGHLGPQAEAVAAVLQSLIERSEQQEEEEEQNAAINRKHGDGSDEEEYNRGNVSSIAYLGSGQYASGVGAGYGSSNASLSEEVCYAEEAKKLLARLAECRPELQLGGAHAKTSCAIM